MNKYAKPYMVLGVGLALTAALLMINGKILGEMTTDLGRILVITALPLIVKGKKFRDATNTRSEVAY